MKTKNIIALLIALPLMAGLTGCKSDDELTAKPAKEMLRVLGGDIEILSSDDNTVVNVSADCHWKVIDVKTDSTGVFPNQKSVFSVFTIQPREGLGDGSVVIRTDQNTTQTNRNATFILQSDGGLQQKVNVSQTGAGGGINLSSGVFAFNADGTSQNDQSRTEEILTITSNTTWKLQPESASWLHLSKTSGGSGSTQTVETVTVSVDPSGTDADRTAKVTVIYGDKSTTFEVSQSGMTDIYLRAPEQMDKMAYEAGRQVLRIESNAEWRAYIPSSVNWLHINQVSDSTGARSIAQGIGNGEITLQYDMNNTARERLTAVVIVAGTRNPKQAVVLVEQVANGSEAPLATSIALTKLSEAKHSANFLLNIASEVVVGEFGLVYTDNLSQTPTINEGRQVIVGNGGMSRGLAYELKDLEEDSRYVVRAFLRKTNSQDVVYSDTVHIKTLASMLTIGNPSLIYKDETSAEVRFSFTSDDAVESYGFVYSSDNEMPTEVNGQILTLGRGGIGGNIQGTINNLQEGTYYVRAFVQTKNGSYVYSNQALTVNIEAVPDVLTISDPMSLYVSNTSAEVRFSFTSNKAVEDYGFVYSATNQTPTRENGTVLTVGRGGTGGNVQATIENLQESTTYYVRAYVLNSNGHTYSDRTLTITTSSSQHEPGESDNPDPTLAPKR